VAIFYHELEQPWALFVGQVPPPHDVPKTCQVARSIPPSTPTAGHPEKSGSLLFSTRVMLKNIPYVSNGKKWNASFHFQKETLKHWDWDAFPDMPKSIHIYFDFHPAH
jgi:hypothetical protein